MPGDQSLNQLTLVLARTPDQQSAFEQFLADQQNPASPNYHHWLTPAEIGERFGVSDIDIATITSWVESQGLQVNWVAPSRLFIGFGGKAANVGRAFQTQLHTYRVNGAERMSVASEPTVPQAIAPLINSVRGLFTIDERPYHQLNVQSADSPDMNSLSGNHFIAPYDFGQIYDLTNISASGNGVSIGIVGWSRTNFADFDNFRQKTDVNFPNPTEIVPTKYGGIDPGPAYTAPPPAMSRSAPSQKRLSMFCVRAVWLPWQSCCWLSHRLRAAVTLWAPTRNTWCKPHRCQYK